MKEIFKLQRSLYASDGVVKVLAYNKTRTLCFEIEASEELIEWFGDDLKIYAIGEVDKHDYLHVISETDSQNW